MADENPKVEIRIEASQKTGAIDATATQTENLERRMYLLQLEAQKMDSELGKVDKTTSELGATIGKFVSAAAIGAFFKAAVEESVQEAEALRVVKGSVESMGASWEKSKGQIEEFAKSQQLLTRFQDDVTYSVLGKLALATSTVGEAMRATALAQDLSVRTGKPLADSVSIVNQLLLGQERAVKMATKEFGNYAGGATTAQQALDNLQHSTMGAAAAEVSATKSFGQLKAVWGDTIQIVGDALVPALVDTATAIRDILVAAQEYLGFIEKNNDAHKEQVKRLTEEKAALIASAASLSSHGAATEENVKEQDRLREAIRLKTAELEKAQAVESRESGQKGGLKARAGIEEADKLAQEKLQIEQKLSDDIMRGVESETQYKLAKLDEELAAAQRAGVDRTTIEAARSVGMATIYKKEADDKKKIDDKAEKDKQKLEEDRKKNFASTMQFISTLSNSHNKELAALGKAASLAAAYINTAQAVTVALRSAPPPYNFALGAAVAAAGAAQVAVIAGVQLEKGGLVPGSSGGTDATIGEKGKPEAVLPLTDSRAMGMVGKAISDAGGGGGGATIININVTAQVPEWRSILEAIGDEAARGSPEIIRVARRLGDLNELYSGRAS